MDKRDFKIGADPEMGFVKGGSLIQARSIVTGSTSTKFGLDGCSAIAELRPDADEDPLAVVESIQGTMLRGANTNYETLNDEIEWKAGSYVINQPIGGHIHFGVRGMGLKADRAIGSLDTWLAQPVLLLEDKEEAVQRRKNHGYGHLADHRPQPWGFEYRTLGSWITSPQVAAGVLCLAKTIMWEVINHDLSPHVHPTDITPYGDDTFILADMPKFRAKFPTLWEHVKKMELYEKYKEPIDFIGSLIERKAKWFPKCGTKEAWEIKDTRIKMETISTTSIWNEDPALLRVEAVA